MNFLIVKFFFIFFLINNRLIVIFRIYVSINIIDFVFNIFVRNQHCNEFDDQFVDVDFEFDNNEIQIFVNFFDHVHFHVFEINVNAIALIRFEITFDELNDNNHEFIKNSFDTNVLLSNDFLNFQNDLIEFFRSKSHC